MPANEAARRQLIACARCRSRPSSPDDQGSVPKSKRGKGKTARPFAAWPWNPASKPAGSPSHPSTRLVSVKSPENGQGAWSAM
jgi:hypothetical protein